MSTEEIFNQSGYTTPTDKHDECFKRFDYWDMIAFADFVTEKKKEYESNLETQIVSKLSPNHVFEFRLGELEMKYNHMMEQFNKIVDYQR